MNLYNDNRGGGGLRFWIFDIIITNNIDYENKITNLIEKI